MGMAFFARVVEAKSFSEAARSLGLSKSAVSSRVARLEATLGLRLLHRTTRRLVLTADGVRLYERCARLVAEADHVAEVAAGASAEPRGTLRIHTSPGLPQPWLAGVIGDFMEAHPDVRVELRFTERGPDMTAALDPFDIAIVVSHGLPDSALVARKLASVPVVACASSSYLQKRGIPFLPQDLVHHRSLVHTLIPSGAWHFDTREGPVSPSTPSFVVDDARFLREAALAGLGIAILPRPIVSDDLAEGRLHPILEEFQSGRLTVTALHPHRKLAPASVRVFLTHLTDRARRPPWDSPQREVPPPKKRRDATLPMTAQDVRRLSAVAAVYRPVDADGAARLEKVLGSVKVMAASEIPRDAVTMNSRVVLRDVGRDREVSLVYPWDARADRVSVLSRLGAGLLGARIASTLEGGARRLTVVALPYQPEAAGDHEL